MPAKLGGTLRAKLRRTHSPRHPLQQRAASLRKGHVPCSEPNASSVRGESSPADTLCRAGAAALPHHQALSPAESAKKNNHSFIGFASRSPTPGAETMLLQLTPSSRWRTMVPFTRHPDLAASPGAGAGIPRRLPAGSSSHMHHAPGEKPEKKKLCRD